MKSLVVVLGEDLHRQFKEKCARQGVSMSSIIRRLVRQWINNDTP